MNQHDAKEMYGEAGQLYAEQQYAAALLLLDKLVQALPANADITLTRAKCLAKLGRLEEAASAARFIQETLQDPRGAELLQTLPRALPAVLPAVLPSELPAVLPAGSDEPRSGRSRTVALALAGVCVMAGTGYLFFMRGEAGSKDQTETVAAVPSSIAPPVKRSASRANAAAEDEAMIAVILSGNDALANASAPVESLRKTPRDNAWENKLPDVVALLEGNIDRVSPVDVRRQLIAAIAANDTSGIAAALKSDPGLINAKMDGSMRGRTPLFLAQSAEVAKLLIDAGATPSGHDDDGILLMGVCAPVVLQTLVDGGGQVNETGPNGWTPLHWAGLNGSLALVQGLLDHAADPNLETAASETCLTAAVRGGQKEIVGVMLANGADVNGPDGTYSAALMELLSNSDSADIFGQLLDAGALVNGRNDRGDTPLHSAAFKKPQFVEPLLERGADAAIKNRDGQTARDLASARGHEAVLRVLDTAVAEVPDDVPVEVTPAERLIEIVEAGDLKAAVELLRDNRALANTLDFENRPVLTYAQSVEMAELLIEAGANHEAPTVGGWTPLMWIAGRNGNTDVAKYLIDLGAWVSIEDVNGLRPIHQAAFMGNHDLVSAFVSSGADINAIDDTDVAPLHAAAWSGDLDGVKLYLSLGADITLQNKKGETPYDVARSREHEELLPLLDPDRTAVSGTGPTTASTQAGTAGTRELKFSNDTNLGTVQIRDWGSTDYKAWESIGSAWGTITVPVGKEVMLMVDMSRLDVLRTIEPEGIQVLHIRDVKLNDDQLKNLYHLKGLQRITFSRTGVSDAAVEALRKALPECTIRE